MALPAESIALIDDELDLLAAQVLLAWLHIIELN